MLPVLRHLFIMLGVSLVAAVSCKTIDEGPKIPEVTEKARETSMIPFKDLRVGNYPLNHYAQNRTAILTSGVGFPEQDPDLSAVEEGRETSLDLQGEVSTGRISFASAAAIDRRGYFVTAAHCVDSNTESLRILIASGDTAVVKKARVVFAGEATPEKESFDFAIIHVPMRLPYVFTWAEDYKPGDKAMLVGTKGDESGLNLKVVLAGGLLKEVEGFSSSLPRSQQVRHSVPIVRGNSGGPLLNENGRLIAVNYGGTSINSPLSAPKMIFARAVRPDLEWLRKTIDDDAKRLEAE